MNFTDQVAWPNFGGREQGDTYRKKSSRMSGPIIPFIMSTIIKHKQSDGTESTNENIPHARVVIMANRALDNFFLKYQKSAKHQGERQQYAYPSDRLS